jgi:hypothetical protein
MIPYHYAIVQVRDAVIAAEKRNVGLVVLCPTLGKAWLRRADLKQRAHLIGDDAAFVRALLDRVAGEANEIARQRSTVIAHRWLRDRAAATEDALTLAEPAAGITADIDAEIARLRLGYLGPMAHAGTRAVEDIRAQVLRALRIDAAPRVFDSGPARWRFPSVLDAGGWPVVMSALAFTQRKPESVLDAAFHNIGRAGEVRAWHPDVRWLTIADGPAAGATGVAFQRACALMTEAGLHVVAPDAGRVRDALFELGVRPRAAEA